MNNIFIDDAKKQFLKLWSVRFSLITSLYGAVQTAMALYDGTNWVTPAVTMIAGVAIAIARVLRQPNLKASGGFEVTGDGNV